MQLIPESSDLADYLKELDVVDYSHPLIQKKVDEIFDNELSEIEKVKVAFEFVRDKVSHSWDIQSKRVTCKASEVLKYQEGICYAKSHLLAALLRSQGIPTGFCYQRLLFNASEKIYCIHALNAVFIKAINCWIRIDARGNKPGIQTDFSINKELLAYFTDENIGEKDYSVIYTKPHIKTVTTLKENNNALNMVKYHLPDKI